MLKTGTKRMLKTAKNARKFMESRAVAVSGSVFPQPGKVKEYRKKFAGNIRKMRKEMGPAKARKEYAKIFK